MGETIESVIERLRKLAVEMVRTHRLSDAAAVLAGVGAVEMLGLFGEPGSSEPKPAESMNGGGAHRAPEFESH